VERPRLLVARDLPRLGEIAGQLAVDAGVGIEVGGLLDGVEDFERRQAAVDLVEPVGIAARVHRVIQSLPLQHGPTHAPMNVPPEAALDADGSVLVAGWLAAGGALAAELGDVLVVPHADSTGMTRARNRARPNRGRDKFRRSIAISSSFSSPKPRTDAQSPSLDHGQ
jgi:hypothetical protein